MSRGKSRAMRPFKEAALALFNDGAPPVVVAGKFEPMIASSTVYRWYSEWATLKGIPIESRQTKNKVFKDENWVNPLVKYNKEKKAARLAKEQADEEARLLAESRATRQDEN
jgi:hypothetical protein